MFKQMFLQTQRSFYSSQFFLEHVYFSESQLQGQNGDLERKAADICLSARAVIKHSPNQSLTHAERSMPSRTRSHPDPLGRHLPSDSSHVRFAKKNGARAASPSIVTQGFNPWRGVKVEQLMNYSASRY